MDCFRRICKFIHRNICGENAYHSPHMARICGRAHSHNGAGSSIRRVLEPPCSLVKIVRTDQFRGPHWPLRPSPFSRLRLGCAPGCALCGRGAPGGPQAPDASNSFTYPPSRKLGTQCRRRATRPYAEALSNDASFGCAGSRLAFAASLPTCASPRDLPSSSAVRLRPAR